MKEYKRKYGKEREKDKGEEREITQGEYRQRGFEIHGYELGIPFISWRICLQQTNRCLESNTLCYSWNTQFIDICGIQILGTYRRKKCKRCVCKDGVKGDEA